MHKSPFKSFFMGGFECSTHRNIHGHRVDVIASSRHDQFALKDYERVRSIGIRTVRDGIRWHLIETRPFHYDFSSVLPLFRAAQRTGLQVIWDVFHYGWPDDINIFSTDFIQRYARFAKAFAKFHLNETDAVPLLCPMNEIAFFSWAAAEEGTFYPYVEERGIELKRQLVRATIEGIEAIWDVAPKARIIHTNPLIRVVHHRLLPGDKEEALAFSESQFHSFEMIRGSMEPELGGSEKYLDIVGLNYYHGNQWYYRARYPIPWRSETLYRPLHEMLIDFYQRFRRPLFLAETGIENQERPDWFRWVCRQVATAIQNGVPIEGICLYPIVNHPGWDDFRHCHNGLWDYADDEGNRPAYRPLERELKKQMQCFGQFLSGHPFPAACRPNPNEPEPAVR